MTREYARATPLRVTTAWGWWENARCRGVTIGGNAFEDVRLKKDVDRARAVCDLCPVRQTCLEEALALEAPVGRDSRFGFRAGLTEKERWTLSREDVAS